MASFRGRTGNLAGIVSAISRRRSRGRGVPGWITTIRHIFTSSFFGELSLREVVSSIFPTGFSASSGVLPALRFV